MAANQEAREALMREIRARFPGFKEAVLADAMVTASHRGERNRFRSKLDALGQIIRLCVVTDAFFAMICYRAKATLQARGVPLLPRLLHRMAMATAQIAIGDPVVVHPGVYIIHGQIVLDGIVEIGPGVTIAPWTTIGLRAGNLKGPTIERGVQVGTGARLLGPWHIGENARIGANAVVTANVPAGATVVGIPARELPGKPPA